MKYWIYIMSGIIFFNYSCKQSSIKNDASEKEKNWSDLVTKTVQHWQGKQIILPKNLPIVNKDSTTYYFDKVYLSPIRMVIYIDGTCGVCISNLKHWRKFMDEINLKQEKCDFIFYIEADNKDEFQNNVISKLGFKITWIFDKENKFINANKLFDKQFQTALLNQKNEVIMIGTIISSPEVENLYKETIAQYGK